MPAPRYVFTHPGLHTALVAGFGAPALLFAGLMAWKSTTPAASAIALTILTIAFLAPAGFAHLVRISRPRRREGPTWSARVEGISIALSVLVLGSEAALALVFLSPRAWSAAGTWVALIVATAGVVAGSARTA